MNEERRRTGAFINARSRVRSSVRMWCRPARTRDGFHVSRACTRFTRRARQNDKRSAALETFYRLAYVRRRVISSSFVPNKISRTYTPTPDSGIPRVTKCPKRIYLFTYRIYITYRYLFFILKINSGKGSNTTDGNHLNVWRRRWQIQNVFVRRRRDFAKTSTTTVLLNVWRDKPRELIKVKPSKPVGFEIGVFRFEKRVGKTITRQRIERSAVSCRTIFFRSWDGTWPERVPPCRFLSLLLFVPVTSYV